MLTSIQSAGLAGLDGVRHGFFTREGGVSSGLYASLNCGLGSSDDPALVRENRRRVAAALGGAPEEVVTLYQEHGATALTVEGPVSRERLPRADAVVTRTPRLVVGVLTADCGPVLLADPAAKVVAAVHAGWRGAISGVAEAAIAEMERLGGSRRRIIAAIGPCISQNAYEVGDDFETEAVARDARSMPFFARPNAGAKPTFDLPGYVAMRLRGAGVDAVSDIARCTYANESEFFSYRRTTHRREGDYGRQISAIVVT